MKKYLFAMMIANASLFACTDLDEDKELCNHDICYDDQLVQLRLYDGVNNFDNYYDDDILEEESDSGDHPDNQDNELIAWM